jgi:hypothetical protein
MHLANKPVIECGFPGRGLKENQRVFESGAFRDNDEDKLDFVRALSPVVLQRYVEYMREHRTLPDGSKRDFDNWKAGMPQDVCLSSLGRHYWDVWKLMHGFTAHDNHGTVDLEDALCGVLFNVQCILLDLLKEREYEK